MSPLVTRKNPFRSSQPVGENNLSSSRLWPGKETLIEAVAEAARDFLSCLLVITLTRRRRRWISPRGITHNSEKPYHTSSRLFAREEAVLAPSRHCKKKKMWARHRMHLCRCGIRTIVVGELLRGLVSKLAQEEVEHQLQTLQACTNWHGRKRPRHSSRHIMFKIMVEITADDEILLKVDIANAYNTIQRGGCIEG